VHARLFDLALAGPPYEVAPRTEGSNICVDSVRLHRRTISDLRAADGETTFRCARPTGLVGSARGLLLQEVDELRERFGCGGERLDLLV
jgi:hypothetical protein